ncbi:MAG: asparaginyl/glutamyl-tRNA amidotransferase subunit C [Candidatus Woesebacteria bacterium GW2011_GWB1_38_5b]|uniref:Aspartyl/glutamyl-tRNA(Asn/Gln) amidotransferase subunit C n=3 Tax=Microgenomates group TaxID=1794810 RepID=A0A1F5G870_9BACT|nr:MAG: asparaginyl/glutamyl-tRNA amidotransferase subunit C [Candidatus Woesebacteria bacterium GW2011_GWB1_38_5b]OGD83319.1 MAG: hypothetical protein A2775_00420 [Candidatus Curtissbacteria bacterium RIFCSPHIGHO2_01_FULL_39_57]OGD88014.1 MAG: hypothetical protein A3D04_03060 [Candidatus Curtissbacteria bacterium RIFCSPHIGHO2_02_FULL_40_16b]OGD90832.1 MAG: hypothetical protein A3E11_01070 [Candidatus Curtissbacteria bacterium RIFCSPHIGHO2_12_FULL_38_37]OGD99696.1 MAG: hypothetical protein A3J1
MSKKNPKLNIDVQYVAKLANLKLTNEQKKKFDRQLREVLIYVNQLSEVDTKKVEPIGQITGLENVTRDDLTAPSLTQEAALKNASRQHNGLFEVDAIFEND